ncbi:MAG TPA: hypothetical protein ENG48_03365 [Candidatus Atribacteria bacterium]|nr:hypothetical protein [Candidatus Atribacteria bacterium]
MKIEKIMNTTITFESEDKFEDILIVEELMSGYLQDKNELGLFASNYVYADVVTTFDSIDISMSRKYLKFKTQEDSYIEVLTDNITKIKIYVEKGKCLCSIFLEGFKGGK